MQRMQRGLEGVVDELFTYSCPKFVAAVPPRLDNLTVNSNQEAYRHQLREFMAFVDQQRQLPVLKQFLKLYTTISLPKLAGLMDTDESSVKDQLRVLEVIIVHVMSMHMTVSIQAARIAMYVIWHAHRC